MLKIWCISQDIYFQSACDYLLPRILFQACLLAFMRIWEGATLLLKHLINSCSLSVIAQWLTCLFILGNEDQSMLAFWITGKSKRWRAVSGEGKFLLFILI